MKKREGKEEEGKGGGREMEGGKGKESEGGREKGGIEEGKKGL